MNTQDETTRAGRPVLKALSLHPQWAWAVMHAGKNAENRSRPWNHRGPLLIHATQHMASEAEKRAVGEVAARAGYPIIWPEVLPSGRIVGAVYMLGCDDGGEPSAYYDGEPSPFYPWAEPGCHHYLFRPHSAFLLPPLLWGDRQGWRGRQGPFNVPWFDLPPAVRAALIAGGLAPEGARP